VTTELLVQQLKNERCSACGRYKTLAFVAFTEGDLVAEVELPPGAYAFQWKFVRGASGEVSMGGQTDVVVVPEAVEAAA
jgi:hypothetical protein